jgi:Zn-finger nucleic acid-binding protein
MICPVCKSDMIDVEYSQIELDYCTKCQGVWFDAEELELLFDTMGLEDHSLSLDDLLHSAEAETSEKKYRCPICNQRMKKTIIGRQPEIVIDVCQQGDGLWFDGGEIGQLIKQISVKLPAKEGSQQKVLTFLGEVFQARD